MCKVDIVCDECSQVICTTTEGDDGGYTVEQIHEHALEHHDFPDDPERSYVIRDKDGELIDCLCGELQWTEVARPPNV